MCKELNNYITLDKNNGTPIVQWLERCAVNLRVVSSNRAPTRVCGMSFLSGTSLGHVSQIRPVARLSNRTRQQPREHEVKVFVYKVLYRSTALSYLKILFRLYLPYYTATIVTAWVITTIGFAGI